jgi:ABC-type polar amino acid transport system ATPase subunit
MRQLADEGMTMIVVTHELGFAKMCANKVMFIENGKIVEASDSKDFFENPKNDRTKEFIAAISAE